MWAVLYERRIAAVNTMEQPRHVARSPISDSKRDLVHEMLDVMEHISAAMHDEIPNEWESLDLTMPQYRALMALGGGPLRMSEIAARLSASLSSATAMIDRLADKGLVQRVPDPADRRVVLCELTSDGREEIARLWRLERAQFEGLARFLSESDLQDIVNAVKKLSTAVDAHAEWSRSSRMAEER